MRLTNTRVEKIQKRLEGTDAFLVTRMDNWRYLSGFTGDSGSLLITANDAFLFTDSRYTEQAQKEAKDFKVIQTVLEDDVVKKCLSELDVKRLLFEKHHITYAGFQRLQERFSFCELLGVEGYVEELRMIKDAEELFNIEKAQEIADDAFATLFSKIKPGVSEKELALDLEFTMRRMGSEGVAFPVIAVSGERSSLPHGVPSDKKLNPGDFVTFDFGARYNGYCSDMTRTFVIGPLDDKHKEIYDIVLEAQMAALNVIKPGIEAKEVDLTGRRIIEEKGYGEYFGHGIGHGVGLNVHEGPGVGKKSDTVLKPGMVITCEPGIYIPGFGGVRIEDIVVVTQDGRKILSQSPKVLSVIK